MTVISDIRDLSKPRCRSDIFSCLRGDGRKLLPSFAAPLTSPLLSSPQLSLKCRAPEVSQYIYQAYDAILKN